MTEQEELLEKIASILRELNISYAVTGGIAITVWGRPRFTADIDIVVELVSQKLDKLAEKLLGIDKAVYVDKRMMQRALERRGEFNFIHPASGLKVDFWVLKNDLFSREQINRAVRKKIANVPIIFVSPEDLILSKLLWYKESESDRQLEDVASVLRRQKKLDWRYLAEWSKIHGTARILQELKMQTGKE